MILLLTDDHLLKKNVRIQGGSMKVKYLIMIFAVMLVATACSNSENNLPAKSSSPANEVSEQPQSTDPLGKYDQPIQLTTVRSLSSTIKFVKGESIDNNIWYRSYTSDLGIEVSNDWGVPDSQYDQKLNVAITSNNLPDFFMVNKTQLRKLVDADMIEDLSNVYQTYASSLTKQLEKADGGIGIENATFNGKMMALPSSAATLDAADIIWVREDWLKKVGLSGPKTIDDIQAIATAFVKQNPGGTTKYGIGLGKDLYSGYAGIEGFSNGFKAYPNSWIKDANGNIVYGSIQPEMRSALERLQQMFKAGLIDPEFGVEDSNKLNEDISSSKIGLFYGQHWNAFSPLPDAYKNDPKADWKPYPIVSTDGSLGQPLLGAGASQFFVVKKGVKHPEAVVKLLNYNLEKSSGPNGRDMKFFTTETSNLYPAILSGDPHQNINIYRDVLRGFKANSADGLSFDGADNYNSILKFQAGDTAFYASNEWAGTGGALSVLDFYDTSNAGVQNEQRGAPTETMLKKGTTLETLEQETFTKIIMGNQPIEAFDKFVEDWKKLGGDDITKEINGQAKQK
jgi:putative aldouronate transport system substrate-binding protein